MVVISPPKRLSVVRVRTGGFEVRYMLTRANHLWKCTSETRN
ncbi:hypothetical protein [Caldivirga sp.]|nr:hypothetical protein [Caldivirga sp.]